MSHDVPAVFDAGVFRPLEPVELAEGTQVVVQVPKPEVADDLGKESYRAWMAYLRRMEALPDDAPSDGFCNRDHDRVIYGI